jgi:D-tyrosyl-tRNA(Tyr) deacylase
MRAVVQRVAGASVRVDGETVGSIDSGLLVYLGVAKGDSEAVCAYLADKIANLRIYEDGEGRMNRSLLEVGGKVLVVSQFTLLADARKGRRPSYSDAADAAEAKALYGAFCACLRGMGLEVEEGRFQAEMAVSSTNLGPVTILLDSAKRF